MNKSALSVGIYILNLTLLAAHGIDSTFWKQWEMPGIAGVIQGFLLFNSC